MLILATGASVALLLCGVAAADASQANFYVGAKVIGCHWERTSSSSSFTPTNASIRCERYSDHRLVKITRTGKAVMVRNWTGWVAPGHRMSPSDGFISAHLGCTVIPTTAGPFLTCSYSKGPKKSHFSISSTSVEINN
jgi:hypothetical protein